MNFPVLRLLKEDFISFYNQSDFNKLIIQYQIGGEDTNPSIYLVCYAMNTDGQPMHDAPIELIFNLPDGIISIKPTFRLGNIELSKDFITGAISNLNFLYFSFTAETGDALFDYVGFDIDANPGGGDLGGGDLGGNEFKPCTINPCPSDCPPTTPKIKK